MLMLASVLGKCARPSLRASQWHLRVAFKSTQFNATIPVAAMASSANQSNRVSITPNLTFVDNSRHSDPPNSANRTLVLLFSWMLAKGQHLDKFTQFYSDYGYDVLVIKTMPRDLILPKNGTIRNADDVLQFVASKDHYRNVLVHGFSVGAYQFGEVLVRMSQDKVAGKKVAPLFRALIFDSAANLAAIPIGFSKALTPIWPLQKLIFILLHLYLKIFYFVATRYYKESEREFLEMNHFRVHSLLFVSKRDPVGSVASNQEVADSWTKRGIPVRMKVWTDSPHVGHFYKHPEEYQEELRQLIAKIQ